MTFKTSIFFLTFHVVHQLMHFGDHLMSFQTLLGKRPIILKLREDLHYQLSLTSRHGDNDTRINLATCFIS